MRQVSCAQKQNHYVDVRSFEQDFRFICQFTNQSKPIKDRPDKTESFGSDESSSSTTKTEENEQSGAKKSEQANLSAAKVAHKNGDGQMAKKETLSVKKCKAKSKSKPQANKEPLN